jgi:hypothetical protein
MGGNWPVGYYPRGAIVLDPVLATVWYWELFIYRKKFETEQCFIEQNVEDQSVS